MEPKFWLERWQSNDTKFHLGKPHPLLVKYADRLPQGQVMVPLCGKTTDMIWLRDRGHEVCGAELSPLACEAFFQENSLPFQTSTQGAHTVYRGEGIQIWCGDFFSLPPEAWQGCTSIYDRAALIALPPPLRLRYTQALAAAMKTKKLTTLLISIAYPTGTIEGPPFSVPENEVRTLYGNAGIAVSTLESGVDVELTGKHPKFLNTEVIETAYLLSNDAGTTP